MGESPVFKLVGPHGGMSASDCNGCGISRALACNCDPGTGGCWSELRAGKGLKKEERSSVCNSSSVTLRECLNLDLGMGSHH